MTLRSVLLLLVVLVASALASGTNQAGLDFLAAKAKEEGVVTLASGLEYKELRAGTGKTPKVDSKTKCHYEGHLIDGTVFDSSYDRGHPATFAPNQVIKGWTEAMQMVSVLFSCNRLLSLLLLLLLSSTTR